MSDPVQKITFAEMRAAGVRGVLVYCSDYQCSHCTRLLADRWADDIRLSDVEPRFVCAACGRRGADVRPDWESLEAFGPLRRRYRNRPRARSMLAI